MVNADVWVISELDLTIRLLVSCLLGGLIGFEREVHNHPAGLRTHILVCIGSTAIMLLSIYGFSQFVYELNVRVDPARLAAQVISGIGFLGAGTILRTGATVSGLTTAASVWVVAAIGLCVGAGFIYAATLTTVIVIVCLFVLNKWEIALKGKNKIQEMILRIYDRPGTLGKIATLLGEQGIQIINVKMKPDEPLFGVDGEKEESVMLLSIQFRGQPEKVIAAMDHIRLMSEVAAVESAYLPEWKDSSPKTKGSVSM